MWSISISSLVPALPGKLIVSLVYGSDRVPLITSQPFVPASTVIGRRSRRRMSSRVEQELWLVSIQPDPKRSRS